MTLSIAREVAALQRLTVKELRGRYADALGETTLANNKAWLDKRIAWRLQARAKGDLSERARKRGAELANDADLWSGPPRAQRPAEAPPEPEWPLVPERLSAGATSRAGPAGTAAGSRPATQRRPIAHAGHGCASRPPRASDIGHPGRDSTRFDSRVVLEAVTAEVGIREAFAEVERAGPARKFWMKPSSIDENSSEPA
jgi:hypothetical protein